MSLGEHAADYAGKGFEVFPCDPVTKSPRHSQLDATTDAEQVSAWWNQWPDSLIGHRVGADQVILDIDPRHGGKGTWDALKRLLEPFTTRTHYSGRDDGGGHIWFKRPEGRLTVTKLDAWAKERELGELIAKTRWTSGIDLLQHEHRYTILPPSPHPTTGRPYRWAKGRGLETEPAEMPAFLAELLKAEAKPAAPEGPTFQDSDSIADWYSATHGFVPLLSAKGWELVSGDGEGDGSSWRHPEATTSVSATVSNGCLFVYSTSTPFEPTEPGSPHGYTPFKAFAVLEHGGSMEAAARQARALKGPGWTGPEAPIRFNGTDGLESRGHPSEPKAATGNLERVVESDHIWMQRPELMHIRDFARARMCSPWALLGVVLAHVAATTPPFVVLPPLVGGDLSLNTYVLLLGGSGSGKDAALNAGEDAIDTSRGMEYKSIGLGSGEGLLDQYVHFVPPDKRVEDDHGHLQRHADSVLFQNPEIETVTALKGRSSSTLMPELRNAWTGKALGFAYANRERRLSLVKHSYRLCLIVGGQPEHCDVLLDDEAAGTPQRFIWLPTDDATAPTETPDDPEPLELHLPRWEKLSGQASVRMGVCDEATTEIREARLRRLRGQDDGGMSAHELANREKVAALLAILEGRSVVNVADWSLAGTIILVSNGTRSRAEQNIARAQQVQSTRRGQAEGLKAAVAGEAMAEEAAKRVARNLLRKLNEQEEWTLRALKHKLAYRDRDWVEEALSLLSDAGQIEREGEGKNEIVRLHR